MSGTYRSSLLLFRCRTRLRFFFHAFLPKATGAFSFQAPSRALLVDPEQRLRGPRGPGISFYHHVLLDPTIGKFGFQRTRKLIRIHGASRNYRKCMTSFFWGRGVTKKWGRVMVIKTDRLFLKPLTARTCTTTRPCLSTTLLPFSSSSFRCWLGGLTAGWLRHCFVRHVNRFGLLSFRV